MTDQEKLEKLRKAYKDVIWMAIRYAHGRATYAPSTVRDSVNSVKEIFPDFKLKQDITLEIENKESMPHILKDDYLFDLFEEKKGD